VHFQPNSTPQNQHVRWGLHSLIYSKLTLSLVDVRLPTHSDDISHLWVHVDKITPTLFVTTKQCYTLPLILSFTKTKHIEVDRLETSPLDLSTLINSWLKILTGGRVYSLSDHIMVQCVTYRCACFCTGTHMQTMQIPCDVELICLYGETIFEDSLYNVFYIL